VLVTDVIEKLCQSEDPETVDAGLTLTLESRRNPFHIASLIASTHSPDFADALIVRHLSDNKFLEVIKPLIQESVLRGADYDVVQPINAFWQKLKKQNELIAWLPLHRVAIERSSSFPGHDHSKSVEHLPSTSVHDKTETQTSRSAPQKMFTTISLPFDQDAAASCVRGWKKHSNLADFG
jgi:Family of unknown function (DUF6183)